MYKFQYDDVISDSSQSLRSYEQMALAHSIKLLALAEHKGKHTREAIDAIFFVNRLWSFFIEDLMKAENGLPPEVRASLISVGLWLLKEAEQISNGEAQSFKGMIDVTQTILEGLEQ